MTKFRTLYDGNAPDTKLTDFDPSLTIQSEQHNCDINCIVEKAMAVGFLPPSRGDEIYGDFSDVPDLMQMHNKIEITKQVWNNIDNKIRSLFNNNIEKFVQFAENRENLQQLKDWKLIDTPQEYLNMEQKHKQKLERETADLAIKPEENIS